jgi:methylmalonyl-CoA mutase N-terminal domain/subunit
VSRRSSAASNPNGGSSARKPAGAAAKSPPLAEAHPANRLARERERWEKETLARSTEAAKERRDKFETSSGISLPPLFDAGDTAGLDPLRDLGFPGEFPFTRGVHPSMYRSRPWTMRQYAGFGTAAETNRRFRYLLQQGQMGLSVAFDLPTQMGYDSDHALAHAEVGRSGVAIDTLADMQTLLEAIPLDQVSTSMTINATAAILLALYCAVARQRGIGLDKISGTVQNDVLKEYSARGTYIYPPGPSLRLAVDIMAFCQEQVPHWNTISVSGYHVREAGCTAVQEVAFTLADGIAYLEAARGRGLDVEKIAGRVSFFFNVHNNFLEEVAKFRAARRLWARIMKERFGARDPRAQALRFHAQTAGSTLTAQQPDNNVVRVALQALAAVCGGAQSLHTNSLDEALCLPTERAVTIALRTQQIIAYESGVADVVDPLGGAYAVESLTNSIDEKASDYLRRIDEMGGAVAAIEAGFFQKEIQEAAYRSQRAFEDGEQVIVGVNRFRTEGERVEAPPVSGLGPEEAQVRRLSEVKAGRSAGRVREALSALERAARGADNLLPPILTAVEAFATLGEISDTLRSAFGKYQPSF